MAMPRRGAAVACLALLAFLATLPSSQANHPQATHDTMVVFDHRGGNEWWVEATVTSSNPTFAFTYVQARVVGTTTWTPLRWTDWGTWAASFHIPAGRLVEFQAGDDGSYSQVWSARSCAFTHPAGVEQCGGGGTAPPFDASFTGVRGNEWWVQAQVATNGPAVAKVEVRLNGGLWQPVAKHSWGWGSSYHIPQGTIVQLRATAVDGQVDLSSCRKWIPPSGQDAQIVACPSEPTPQPGAFDATFTNLKGNEYWAEVVITANHPVDLALLTVNCGGDPHDMVYRADWGKWVLGTHIPAGSKVYVTAYSNSADGTDRSATVLWPQATQTTPC